jgi:hypothetical protein
LGKSSEVPLAFGGGRIEGGALGLRRRIPAHCKWQRERWDTIFEGRDNGHISTEQIQKLVDGCSRQRLQVELVGDYLNPQFALFSDQVT